MTASTDNSRRYVLPEDAPYVANLAALWTADPRLAARIEAMSPEDSYGVEPSRSGLPTAALSTEDGRRVYLHSRYDPAEEARRFIDTFKVSERVAFFVFGLGLGYHLEELFDRGGEEALIFVIEPDLRLLKTAFEQRDLSRLIESGRVVFFTTDDKGELLNRLMPHTALLSVAAETVVHAPSRELAGPFHQRMQELLNEFESFMRTSVNTLILNGRRTAENIARNIGWYAAAPDIERLRDRHKGQPAIIVAAGPSLRKNKHLLPGLRGKAVIIAVQTTLLPLLEAGVEPHYVTALDYHEFSTRFFERLPASLRTELVAEPKANSAIFSMNPGPLSLLGNEFAEGLLREMKLNKPCLPAGATVAHLAFYLAQHLGCDPVIFVGQDLGFGDGLCYTPGTSYEDVWRPELSRFCSVEMKQWEQIVRERFILRRIPDFQGRPMYTEERLFTYLQQFERDFMNSRIRVIDATEGGAAKRGTTVMPLAEAAEQFCKDPLPAAPAAHPGLSGSKLTDCLDCMRRRCGEAREIERISRDTLPLLQEISDHIEDQVRVNRAISAVDGLRARMNELGSCYDLVTQLTQPTELKRFEADRKISAARLNAADKQRRQVGRDIENVEGIRQAAQDFQRLMDEVIAQLEADSGDERYVEAA